LSAKGGGAPTKCNESLKGLGSAWIVRESGQTGSAMRPSKGPSGKKKEKGLNPNAKGCREKEHPLLGGWDDVEWDDP